jgi:hypothetical protein
MARGALAFVLALALASGASACGGRTLSTPANGGSSAGGSSAGGSSTGGSSAGGSSAGGSSAGGSGGGVQTGGTSSVGNGLTQVPPLVQVAPGSSPFPDRHPHLVTSSDDAQQVSVVFSRLAPNGVQLHHATFLPWTDWPASGVVAPVYESFSGPDVAPDFRVGASSDGYFALLVWHDVPGVRFAPEVDASASGAPSGQSLVTITAGTSSTASSPGPPKTRHADLSHRSARGVT